MSLKGHVLLIFLGDKLITAAHLSKYYGRTEAVSNLSFTVPDGCVCGFLGPNGAGKSTTMQMLAGCLAPTEGTVVIDGTDIDIDPVAAKKKTGYLPEVPPLYPELTVKEMLTFAAEMKAVPKAEIKWEVDRVTGLLSIGDVRDRLIRVLSKGYRQRVGFAAALLGDPSFLILDEPTEGLDPGQINKMRELIRTLGKDHTILISSHILTEIQNVCDSVMILSRGKMAANLDRAQYGVIRKNSETLEKLFLGLTAEPENRPPAHPEDTP